MKRLWLIGAPLVALAALAVGVIAVGGFGGGSSGTAALAAAQGQQDIFSALDSAQQDTETGERLWLGIRVVRTSDGLTIAAVIADSPADKAGLQRGDVITAVDGTDVSEMDALRGVLKDKAAGDTLVLSITRDGAAQDVSVTLEARPEPFLEAHPLLPELNDIPRDEMFSHMLGGSFQFTDKDGSEHSATIELGTVSAVDATAKTISVDLNSGGSQTYTITDDVTVFPSDLTEFESGDNVTVMSVDGALRAVSKGHGGMMFPFFGGGPGRGHHGGWDGGGHRGMGGPGMGGPGFDMGGNSGEPGF